MSTKNQPVVANRAPTTNRPASPATRSTQPKKQEPKIITHEKPVACRLFALLFLVAGVLGLVVLPFGILSKAEGMPLYQAIMELVKADGFTFAVTEGVLNIVYNASIYAFALCLAVATLLSLVGLCTAKRSVLKVMLVFLNVGAILYTAVYAIVRAVASLEASPVELYSLLFAVAVLVATIVCVLVTKPTTEVIQPEVVKEEDDGFELEEYAEAYPYEGGPVAGVVMAEEVNPSFLRHEPHVQTAGYDFYNSKAFDPFIATLTEEERNQFTELFILRFSGSMPDIPDYKVGGDNAEFFRRIFIYLGQYRDRIPSELLAKIYQYSLKLN